MANKNDKAVDPVLDELQAIRRLMIFGLIRAGASQGEVAAALGVNQSSVSRMFPKPKGIKAAARKKD
ncbi:MAG: hypothetical protein GIKADHBN_02424 [Phycisphaerales bacterium]|nr:hypothetical protein [Phycisphaerales bacterium]